MARADQQERRGGWAGDLGRFGTRDQNAGVCRSFGAMHLWRRNGAYCPAEVDRLGDMGVRVVPLMGVIQRIVCVWSVLVTGSLRTSSPKATR